MPLKANGRGQKRIRDSAVISARPCKAESDGFPPHHACAIKAQTAKGINRKHARQGKRRDAKDKAGWGSCRWAACYCPSTRSFLLAASARLAAGTLCGLTPWVKEKWLGLFVPCMPCPCLPPRTSWTHGGMARHLHDARHLPRRQDFCRRQMPAPYAAGIQPQDIVALHQPCC